MSTSALRRNLASRTLTTMNIHIGRRSLHWTTITRRCSSGRMPLLWDIVAPSKLNKQNLNHHHHKHLTSFQYSFSQRSSLSSSSSSSSNRTEEDKGRLTTLRLYRILQRQCMALSQRSNKNNNGVNDDEEFLIQPQLRAPDWGRHSKFMIPPPTTILDLYRLFYSIFEEDEDDDNDNDETYDEKNTSYSSSSPSFQGSIHHWYDEILGGGIVHPPAEPEGVPMIPTCWTSVSQLRMAIRQAFRTSYSSTIEQRHLQKWAIHAIQLLQQQKELWDHSSVAVTENVRIVATSRCIGTTVPASSLPPAALPPQLESKYRFSYRIRIENIATDPEEHVQLLGRHWNLQELEDDEAVILEDGEAAIGSEASYSREPVIIDAPYTGVVGHMPVLRPGQCFEYMSGTDLATTRGMMTGKFYMARVPPGTPSFKTGDIAIDKALQQDDNKFQADIATFPLVVD